jgi:A/G-specific adenine glycosylase
MAHDSPDPLAQYIPFTSRIWEYYRSNKRAFPWRETTNPYHIVVSEVMLQQTQTDRVVEKYCAFIKVLSTFDALAIIDFAELLGLWSGLGYNRRALYLQSLACTVVEQHGGILPDDPEILVELPGIGKATAASITAFAFNKPTVFIETNIRAVFIHEFFSGRGDVHDREIMPLVAATVDQQNPREWYYALMDYGVMLKKKYKNPSRRSVHHTQQSRFEGSERQIRGMILRVLLEQQLLAREDFYVRIPRDPERIDKNLDALCSEGFLMQHGELYSLAQSSREAK